MIGLWNDVNKRINELWSFLYRYLYFDKHFLFQVYSVFSPVETLFDLTVTNYKTIFLLCMETFSLLLL